VLFFQKFDTTSVIHSYIQRITFLLSLKDFQTIGVGWSEGYRTPQRSSDKNFSRKKIKVRSEVHIGDTVFSQIMVLFPPQATDRKQ